MRTLCLHMIEWIILYQSHILPHILYKLLYDNTFFLFSTHNNSCSILYSLYFECSQSKSSNLHSWRSKSSLITVSPIFQFDTLFPELCKSHFLLDTQASYLKHSHIEAPILCVWLCDSSLIPPHPTGHIWYPIHIFHTTYSILHPGFHVLLELQLRYLILGVRSPYFMQIQSLVAKRSWRSEATSFSITLCPSYLNIILRATQTTILQSCPWIQTQFSGDTNFSIILYFPQLTSQIQIQTRRVAFCSRRVKTQSFLPVLTSKATLSILLPSTFTTHTSRLTPHTSFLKRDLVLDGWYLTLHTI